MNQINQENTSTSIELDWCTAYATTHIGKVRSNNEDNYLLQPWQNESAILAVVADGMGGNRSGEIASKIAIDSFAQLLQQPLPDSLDKQFEMLVKQCYIADEEIRKVAYSSFHTLGMGTTIISAIITPSTCIHAYAGDSRLYHFRHHQIAYQSTDNTIVQLLVETGRITPEDIPTHPMRSTLTSCLGGKNAEGKFSVYPKLQEEKPVTIDFKLSDSLLLCSDGLTNLVDNKTLENIINHDSCNPEKITKLMLENALNNGGKDNITILNIYRKSKE